MSDRDLSSIELLLEQLLNQADKKDGDTPCIAVANLTFRDGTQLPLAGSVKRGPVPGLYVMAAPAGDPNRGATQIIEFFFEGRDLARFGMLREPPRIATLGGGVLPFIG